MMVRCQMVGVTAGQNVVAACSRYANLRKRLPDRCTDRISPALNAAPSLHLRNCDNMGRQNSPRLLLHDSWDRLLLLGCGICRGIVGQMPFADIVSVAKGIDRGTRGHMVRTILTGPISHVENVEFTELAAPLARGTVPFCAALPCLQGLRRCRARHAVSCFRGADAGSLGDVALISSVYFMLLCIDDCWAAWCLPYPFISRRRLEYAIGASCNITVL